MPIMDGYDACLQIKEIYKKYNEKQMNKKDESKESEGSASQIISNRSQINDVSPLDVLND